MILLRSTYVKTKFRQTPHHPCFAGLHRFVACWIVYRTNVHTVCDAYTLLLIFCLTVWCGTDRVDVKFELNKWKYRSQYTPGYQLFSGNYTTMH